MLYIGCHLSISKGFLDTAKRAVSLGANTFQFFSRNPRGGARRETDLDDINKFIEFSESNNMATPICHAPYTLNPASSKDDVREFAYMVFKEDIELLENIPNALYNFHPGSHVGDGVDVGIDRIVELLNKVMYKDMKTTILLETMAGKGSEIGSSFEELKRIIDRLDYKEHIGVCLDTCHVWDAGYDISDFDKVLDEFDRIIGLDKLKAMHINDSKNPIFSHKDRHELIGKGYIGLDNFVKIINNERIKGIPMCLETPVEKEDDYKDEISLLKNNYRG